MPSLDEISRIVKDLNPSTTSLFLGAGAAITSGAPTAIELCRYLEAELASGERISDDLAELSSILVARRTRAPVIAAVTRRLSGLTPDGALITLAGYPWSAIYTTNYDQLLESAFEKANRSFSVVRNNYEWDNSHVVGRVPIFKIHGCTTQDTQSGHRAGMILTLEDYDACLSYRQLLYQRLNSGLAGGVIVVIGYSLQDRDVQDLFRESVKLQREQGAPGRIHLVMYQIDGERADVWRLRGAANVAQGDINKFVHGLQQATPVPAPSPAAVVSFQLLPELAACTINVATAPSSTNAIRLFYGAPATYGDIRAGLTFERDVERELLCTKSPILLITGVAGTGKSTLARRILSQKSAEGLTTVYEHRVDFPFDDKAWVKFETALRSSGKHAVLLIDNCTQFQRELNRLCRALPDQSHLGLVLTAETSSWQIRQKDPRLFSDTQCVSLSSLSRGELTKLLLRVREHTQLAKLVSAAFLSQQPRDQILTLERRCQADMFVCLKALFSAESLDQIILTEYANLQQEYQEVYKITCALEAAGALPHRQMVLRVTGLSASLVSGALAVLQGMIEETETNAALGIYAWRSRHEVIANLISKYKFSDQGDLFTLLSTVIATANPSIYEEARTLREMCTADRGIRAILDREERLLLFRRVSAAMPGDRVARHRLVSELLYDGRLADAEAELTRAIEEVGIDPPLQRFKVRLEIARSHIPGLMREDRKAMLNQALNEADSGVKRYPDTKHLYVALADAALEWVELTGERGRVVWAADLIGKAYERLLDPDLNEKRRELLR